MAHFEVQSLQTIAARLKIQIKVEDIILLELVKIVPMNHIRQHSPTIRKKGYAWWFVCIVKLLAQDHKT